MKKACILVMALCVVSNVWAVGLEPIPQESGFDGYINIGASWLKVKSNSFAGVSFQTLTNDRINSIYASPDSEDNLSPMFSGEFRYTFADSRTQIFLGNSLVDFLQFDMSNALGVRQELADKSILEGSFLFSGIPTEVWSDPFLTGANRSETDRNSTGARLAWGRLFGTSLQVQYSYRDIDIDKERSGVSQGLNATQQALLDRNGNQHRGEVMYTFQINENNWLAPMLSFTKYGLDGDAMACDRYGLLLTHIYGTKKFKLVTNLSYALNNYDDRHPIYLRTRDDDIYGVSTTLFVPNFLNHENLTGNIGIAYWYQDSNIRFYEEEILAVTVGTLYTF